MGRGFNGGRSRSLQEILRRRLESCKSKYKTINEIVDHLRSNYPDYQRTKQQTLARFVQEALEYSQRVNKKRGKKPTSSTMKNGAEEEEDDDDEEEKEELGRSASRKRLKKNDERELRLQSIESSHLRRIQGEDRASTSSSSTSSGSSESDDDENGAVSTSEDAIYGEKVEPNFDLMKSILRETYSGPKNAKTVAEDKIVELEVTSNKKTNKIGVINVDRGEERLSSESKGELRGLVMNGDANVEVKGNEGPRFRDLGGMKEVLEDLTMEVLVPLFHPQLTRAFGVRPMAGILLHGPPGCGKTKLACAIANETGVPFYMISATEVVSGVSGASEENIRDLFSKAYRTAPSIIFIDEIDAIASKRENLQREMERRIVTQLMTCMDESHRIAQPIDTKLNSNSDHTPGYVLVIGATNRPDAVDPALRRPGRFDHEIALGVPDENARVEILSLHTRNLKLEGSFDFLKLARATSGFVGADLARLADKASMLALRKILVERKCKLSQDSTYKGHPDDWWKQPWLPEEMDKLAIKMSDFEEAVKLVQPSLKKEGFSSIPNEKWEDVGGLEFIRQAFYHHIVRRIKYPEAYEEFGLDLETGFLLYGPPGCGKTLIAKAVANEAGANFIHIKGPELLNKYVGESELAVRTLFSRARTCSPCILFFDEVDALTTKRGKEGGWVVERLLNQLLIELSGAEQRRGVFVIGATNRPEVMDDAVLRPGRFGKHLYVPLPSPVERGLILKALARKKPVDPSVDLSTIGRMEACENLSGADLAALMDEAAMAALDEQLPSTESTPNVTSRTIKAAHFKQALDKITPSVSEKQIRFYKAFSESYKAA
ncbi:cell division control protein 48-like C [Quillaja saponaria]|uniref:Cell division control protein 48-like C n=1 Tax=Quillaja saponaria TaxID=32244 RepID=A0AAD7PV71_QUISA|nr:cell division control protein 48-like C [Quillaja saponaria]